MTYWFSLRLCGIGAPKLAALTIFALLYAITQPLGHAQAETVTAGGTLSFSVSADGTPSPTFQWQKNGAAIPGATSTLYTFPIVTLADAGAYTVIATNTLGSEVSLALILNVTPAGSSTPVPAIVVQPINQVVTAGNAVTFAVSVSASNPTYQWFKNGVTVAGATGTTYLIGNVLGVDAGGYHVVVTNAGGSVTSSTATLTVVGVTTTTLLNGGVISGAPWNNDPQYQGANAFDGNGATFFASRQGDPFAYVGRDLGAAKTISRIRYIPRGGFTDRMNGGRFRGANAADLSDAVTLHTIGFNPPEGVWQDVVLAVSATGYRYVFFTTSYENNGNVAELEFYGSGGSLSVPQITSQPQSQTITEGNPVTFTVSTSAGNPTYQWFKDGVAIVRAVSANYAIGTVLGVDAGGYSVVVTNAGGSVTSSTATLTVVGVTTSTLLSGGVISSAPYDNNPAYAGARAFDGNGATFFASRQGDPFAYVGRDLGAAKTISRIRYIPRGGFTDRMNGGRFRGANAADLSDAVTLHTIGFNPPEGVWQDVVLAVSATGYRYVFFTTSYENNGNVAELEFHGTGASPSAPPIGTLLNGGVISGAPWNNDPQYQGANAFDGNGATFFASRQGDPFAYVGRDLGAAKTISRIRYLPRIGFTARMVGGRFRGANAADLSDAVTLHTIGLNPPDGVWQDVVLAVSAAGYRYVFFTTSYENNGSVAELEFYGSGGSLPAPQITSQPQSQTITEGNPVTFAVSTSAGNPTYQWFKNGAAIVSAVSANYAIGTVLGVDAGGYHVVVTSAGVSVTSSTATLTVVGVTTATLLSGGVISSAPWNNDSQYQGANALDGNGATFFASRQGDAFAYVGRDLGAARIISGVRYLPRAGFTARMEGGRFRGANAADLSDAVTLHTIPFVPPEGVWQDVVLAVSATGYRYVFFTTSYENGGNVAELEFYGMSGSLPGR